MEASQQSKLPVQVDNIWALLRLSSEQEYLSTPVVLCISGRRLGSGRPGKSRFISDTDEMVSVEKLVMGAMFRGELMELEDDASKEIEAGNEGNPALMLELEKYQQLWSTGGWRGWHCEGSPLRTLFALLMWDVLFMSVSGCAKEMDETPSEVDESVGAVGAESMLDRRGLGGHYPVFITPYQDAPLDLSKPRMFYIHRRDAIEARLSAIAALSSEGIIQDIGSSYRSHYRQKCRGLAWAHPLTTLQAVAVCLGGAGLAGIFRMFCVNHSYFSGGAPDLLMIRVVAKQAVDKTETKMSSPDDLQEPSRREVDTLDLDDWLGADWESLGREARETEDYFDLLQPKRGRNREARKTGSSTKKSTPVTSATESEEVDLALPESSMLVDASDGNYDSYDLGQLIADVGETPSPSSRPDPFLCESKDLCLPSPRSSAQEWSYEACLVEVKGPTDSLAPRQLLWLQALREYGVNAVVCAVHEPSLKMRGNDETSISCSNSEGGLSRKRRKSSPYIRMYE